MQTSASWKVSTGSTEAGELELTDSETHNSALCKLYSLELGGFFKACSFFPLRRYKDLKAKGSTHYHMTLWELPPSLTKVLPFH